MIAIYRKSGSKRSTDMTAAGRELAMENGRYMHSDSIYFGVVANNLQRIQSVSDVHLFRAAAAASALVQVAAQQSEPLPRQHCLDSSAQRGEPPAPHACRLYSQAPPGRGLTE